MRKTYKDRMLPEAFKKQMEKKKAQKKKEKREDPGGNMKAYFDTPKMKRGMKREDPKGDPAGYYDSNKKKKADMGRKGPYADGMGKKCTCDSIAEEFNAVLDTEAREDKPCGNSYIPETAKCEKGRGTAKKAGTSPKDYSLRQLQGSGEAVQKRRAQFYKAKATTKGIGNKIKRAGEFAANAGAGAAIGLGAAQTYGGIMTGNLGQASRGLRTLSLGTSAAQLAGASKASRLGNKKLAKEFSKSAGKLAAFGVGQEAALGGIAGYKRTGGNKALRRRVAGLRNTAARRAQGVRRYRG